MPNIKFVPTVISKLLAIFKCPQLTFHLTFDLEDGLDPQMSPLKMCAFMWCICMPNIKSVPTVVLKLKSIFKCTQLTSHLTFDLEG